MFSVTLLKERSSRVQKTWRLCIFLVSCARDEIPSSDLKSCLGLSFSFSNVRWLLSFSITSLFRLCPHPLIQDIFGTYSCTFFVLFQAKRSIPTCPLLLGIFSWQKLPPYKICWPTWGFLSWSQAIKYAEKLRVASLSGCHHTGAVWSILTCPLLLDIFPEDFQPLCEQGPTPRWGS